MNARVRTTVSTLLASAAIVSFLLGCGEAIFGLSGDEPAGVVTQMYYTTDDGKTYFADDASKIAPFDKDGKPAVRCYVFKCADGKPFVAYLEQMTPDAKKKYEAAMKNPKPNGGGEMDLEMIYMEGTEVKKPGEGKWVKLHGPDADKITQINCPDGNNEALKIVLPDN